MQRIWALVERDLRRFSKSPALIVMSCIMPIVQLVVLGYAFGGKVKGLKLGVVDQRVVTASGAEILVPMRVMPNGTGAEVAFTLFRQPEMSAEIFARDAAWVARDLAALKALLEA